MRLTIEPTDESEHVSGWCRVWRGTTDAGVPVVVRVSYVIPNTHDPELIAAFASELNELRVTGRRVISSKLTIEPLPKKEAA